MGRSENGDGFQRIKRVGVTEVKCLNKKRLCQISNKVSAEPGDQASCSVDNLGGSDPPRMNTSQLFFWLSAVTTASHHPRLGWGLPSGHGTASPNKDVVWKSTV